MVSKNEERAALIKRRENFWYPEKSRVAVLDELSEMYNDPQRHRTRSIAIIADSNGGKSQIPIQFMRRHPVILSTSDDYDTIPAIAVSMTGIRTLPEFSRQLLAAVRAPARNQASSRPETYEFGIKRFMQHARKVQLKIIFLDEFHDCVKESKGEQFLRAIKSLLLEHFYIVPMGTEELIPILEGDPQIWSRINFKRGRLGNINDLGVIKTLIHKLTASEMDVSDAALTFIKNATDGIIGHILDLIEETLTDQKKLDYKSLQEQVKTMSALDNILDVGKKPHESEFVKEAPKAKGKPARL